MPKAYSQVSLEERCEIAKRLGEGPSLREIAAALDRPPSTISREVARNGGRKAGYKPAYADQQTKARRWTGSKLARKPELGAAVLECLAKGWSPEQVAGRLKRENNKAVVSHETIYRFIYAELVRTKTTTGGFTSRAPNPNAAIAVAKGAALPVLSRPACHLASGQSRPPIAPQVAIGKPT